MVTVNPTAVEFNTMAAIPTQQFRAEFRSLRPDYDLNLHQLASR